VCCRLAVVLISTTNRSVPNAAASSGFRTLRATFRSCFKSWATYTVAMPPLPQLPLDAVAVSEGRREPTRNRHASGPCMMASSA
jgi:hypothetical protein